MSEELQIIITNWAQKQAADFYKQFGFIYTGEEFMDAGILHQAMYQQLNNKI